MTKKQPTKKQPTPRRMTPEERTRDFWEAEERGPVTPARRAYEDAKARHEQRLDALLVEFHRTRPEGTRLWAEMLAAEAAGDKVAERCAERAWQALYFREFLDVQDDAELFRLWREREDASRALGAALIAVSGDDEDEEDDDDDD